MVAGQKSLFAVFGSRAGSEMQEPFTNADGVIGPAEPTRLTVMMITAGLEISSNLLRTLWLRALLAGHGGGGARRAAAVTRSLVEVSCRHQAGRKQVFLSMRIRQEGITNP